MSIRHLRTLVAIAEHGTFAAAAGAVSLTQSAVSAQMKSLEAELGVALFDRSRRPPALSDVGRALVPHAREVVAGYDGLRERARGDASLAGRLRLGAVGSVLTTVLPRALAALEERHPMVHVALSAGFTDELIGQVDRGALDAAVVSDLAEPPPGLAWHPFLREPLVLIAPPDAPEDTPQKLAARYGFIGYAPSASAGRVIEAAVRSARLGVRERMRLDWLEAIESMVSAGLGIAVVPRRSRLAHPGPPLRHLSLPGPAHHRTLGVVAPRDGESPLAAPLLETLRSVSREVATARELLKKISSKS